MKPQTEALHLTLILLMIFFGSSILSDNNALGLDWGFGLNKNNVDEFDSPVRIMILTYKKYRLLHHNLEEKDYLGLQYLAS
tara:strand:+ start:29 stop:271 length:243 start_codon:yes stop_codon:yes gene_type:complete